MHIYLCILCGTLGWLERACWESDFSPQFPAELTIYSDHKAVLCIPTIDIHVCIYIYIRDYGAEFHYSNAAYGADLYEAAEREIHIYVYIHMYVYSEIYIHKCIYIHIYACMHMCICVYVCICIYVYIHDFWKKILGECSTRSWLVRGSRKRDSFCLWWGLE